MLKAKYVAGRALKLEKFISGLNQITRNWMENQYDYTEILSLNLNDSNVNIQI